MKKRDVVAAARREHRAVRGAPRAREDGRGVRGDHRDGIVRRGLDLIAKSRVSVLHVRRARAGLVVVRIGHRRVILLIEVRHHLAVLVAEEHGLVHVVVLAGLEVLRVGAHLGGALRGAGRAHRACPSARWRVLGGGGGAGALFLATKL